MDVLLAPRLLNSKSEVSVVYTTPEGTRRALAKAMFFSRDLKIRVRVLAFQVVPFPLAIDKPSVSPEFAVEQILSDLGSLMDTEFTLQYSLCRDRDEALARCLSAESIVVIGGPLRFIWSREQRMARRLEKLGHEIVFVPTGNASDVRRWFQRYREFAQRWLLGTGSAHQQFLERK
jgi:hypothetical protein